MVQHYLEALGPALVVVGAFLVLVSGWNRQHTFSRAVACVFVAIVAARYLWWRATHTILPDETGGLAVYWVWLAFFIELLAFLEIILFLITMSRHADRSAEADRLGKVFLSQHTDEWPRVDLFIPTYDEPLDVLERTIVGAQALDYPSHKLKIYVLDDQRREWLQEFCLQRGVTHLTRSDNAHAKAGNMNNGLRHSDGDLVAVFDADFVPYRRFLKRTVPFFADPTIGIVQTPQHFFNKDPVQSNLGVERVWPDEQRLFFDEMAASRDAWDCAFCCGSCSIMRRKSLDAIGGFPTESITEDLLTTLAMLNKGYKTRYLNERLSMGLAAENLRGYFIQRSRWCRGGLQSLFLRAGPIRGPGLTLLQRIMFLPVSWLVQYVVRFFALVVPAIYLWTGLAPLYSATTLDIVYYQLPVVLAYFLLMRWIAPSRYLPIVSSAVGVFSTFRLLPTVIATLIKPFGVPFRVTPKGSANEQSEFDSYTFTCIAIVIAFTAAGIVLNIVPELAQIWGSGFSEAGLFWAAINVVILAIAALICFERSRPLQDSFWLDEPAQVGIASHKLPGRLVGLSLESGSIEVSGDFAVAVGEDLIVEAGTFPLLRARVEGVSGTGKGLSIVTFRFSMAAREREQLIVKLYTGEYSQEIHRLETGAVAWGLWKRAFGRISTKLP